MTEKEADELINYHGRIYWESQEKMSKELDKMLFEYRTEPYFPDDCGHGGYLFSFTSMERNTDREKYDVYCFRDFRNRQEFCLRFGRDGDYCSPGTINNIIQGARHGGHYENILTLLKYHGAIEFVSIKKESKYDS